MTPKKSHYLLCIDAARGRITRYERRPGHRGVRKAGMLAVEPYALVNQLGAWKHALEQFRTTGELVNG
jgi:hypothetical protein